MSPSRYLALAGLALMISLTSSCGKDPVSPTEQVPLAWQVMSSGTTTNLIAVGGSGSRVYAGGNNGVVRTSNGGGWSAMTSGIQYDIDALWSPSSSAAYYVSDTQVWRDDGTGWKLFYDVDINSVDITGTSQSNIYVASDRSLVHYDGADWTVPAQASRNMTALWCRSANDVFLVGVTGLIGRYNGGTITEMTSGTTNTLTDIWGSSATNVYAVGLGATIRRYNGTDWIIVNDSGGPLGSTNFYGVWGTSANNVYIVGEKQSGSQATVWHWNGSSWTNLEVGSTATFRGIWGSSASNVYLVGDGGVIVRFGPE